MGSQAEKSVTKPFMKSLCLADQIAQNYMQTTHHLAEQEELKLQVLAKSIDLTNFSKITFPGNMSRDVIKLQTQ
jgi:hypothetical protein